MKVSEFFDSPGPLATAFGGGYTRRPEQVAMSEAVARAVAEKWSLLADAPTGTGKSQGYLVPLALAGANVGAKAVVATGTIALQHQLVEKDIPVLREACRLAGLKVPSAALLKGRGNFLCQRRFGEYQEHVLGFEGDAVDAVTRTFGESTTRGDKAELDAVPSFWAEVASDSDDCNRKTCPHRQECFFFRHKDAATEADILVVNHALFAVNLASGGQVFDMAGRHLVIDEAHKFEDQMMRTFGAQVTAYRMRYVCKLIGRRLAGEEKALGDVEDQARAFFEELKDHRTLGDPDAAPPSYKGLRKALWRVYELVRFNPAEAVNDLAPAWKKLIDDLESFYKPLKDTHAYGVVWGERSMGLSSWLVEPADTFRKLVIERDAATILTSATLAVGRRFDYVSARLGFDDGAEEYFGREIFDYKSNALVYVASDLPHPTSDDAGFLAGGVARARQLVGTSAGRALILLATKKALDYYRDHLGLEGYPVRFQGDAPPNKLVEWMKTTPGAVLVGTRTLWEGVDVPGEALSLIVIDKAPFPYMKDPVIERLSEKAGRESFKRVSLPRALMVLQQGAGRLIRTHEDRGVIAILDSRIAASPWGKDALRSLPSGAPRTSDVVDVRAFFDPDRRGAA